MEAIFDFVENILTSSGVGEEAMNIITQVFDSITGLFDLIGNLFG